jgi:hypothetical protein
VIAAGLVAAVASVFVAVIQFRPGSAMGVPAPADVAVGDAPRPAAPATPPPPAPEPASDPFAVLDAQFARLKSASAALRASPQTVRLGEDVDVVLRVSPLMSEAELLQRMQSPGSVIEKGAARIAPRMTAHLSAAGAIITVVGSEERAVPGSEDTEWQWKVTPARDGTLPIHVTLSAPVMVQGKETSYQVRTFDATVIVTVAPATRVASFVANNWQWLWTTIAVPAALWVFRSRARRGPRRRQRGG